MMIVLWIMKLLLLLLLLLRVVVVLLLLLLRMVQVLMMMLLGWGGLMARRRYDRQAVVGRILAAHASATHARPDGVMLRRVKMAAATVMQLLLAVVREHLVGTGSHAVRVSRASCSDDRRPVIVRSHVAAAGHDPAAAVVRRRRFGR